MPFGCLQCRAQSFTGQVKSPVGRLLHYKRLASTGGKAAGFQLATSSWQEKIFAEKIFPESKTEFKYGGN